MKELAQLFLAFIAKTNGISEEQAAELLYQKSEDGKLDESKLNENALSELESLDAERVTKIKGGVDTTKAFEDGYKKAQKETLTKFENSLRKEYKVEDDKLQGTDLISHIVKQSSGKGKTQLSEDEIKKSPLYLNLEKQLTEAVEGTKTEYEKKIEDMQKNWETENTLKTVKSKVIAQLDSLNPVLPKNATAATNQKNQFATLFDTYGYQVDGDSILVLDKESGKRIEDKHGNPVKFEDMVNTKAADYFEFAKQGSKGSAGNGNDGGAGSSVTVPKTEADYNKAIFEAKTAEERAEIQAAYEEANPSD